MLIQFQSQHLAVLKLKLEPPAIEPLIVFVDNAVVVRTEDNDVRRVVILLLVNLLGNSAQRVYQLLIVGTGASLQEFLSY